MGQKNFFTIFLFRGTFFSFFFLFFFVLFFLVLSHAVEAVSLSPLRQTISLDPGTKETVEIEIKNDTDKEKFFFASTDAFSVDDQSQEIHFGVQDEAINWVSSSKKAYALEPGETRSIPFEINIPKEAQPGAHYLGLFVSESPGDGHIAVQGKIGSLLFLYVSGVIQEDVSLDYFSSDQEMYFRGEASFMIQLKNNGTVHTIPSGVLTVKRGDCIVSSESINTEKRKIFPHTSLQWETKAPLQTCGMGFYRATLFVQYGLTERTLIQSISFYYIPIQFIVFGILLASFLIIFGFVFYKKKYKKK